MANGLQLSQRLTQSLVLAPQLQQSLALLQAPALELKALVEQELQQNPVLEEDAAVEPELREKSLEDDVEGPAEQPDIEAFDAPSEKESPAPVDDFQVEFERLVQLDQEWRDYFSQTNFPIRNSPEEEEKRQFMFNSLVADTSLKQILLEQARELKLPEKQWPICELIIGSLDEYGYFRPWFAETIRITVSLRGKRKPRPEKPEIHYFDPNATLDQARQFAVGRWPEHEHEIDVEKVIQYFESRETAEQFASKHWPVDKYKIKSSINDLSESNGIPVAEIEQVLKSIQTFEPPGVGARDLRECLMLQLERAGRQNSLEYNIVHDYMDLLGKRRIAEIAKNTEKPIEEIQQALANIARLEPRPGRAFMTDTNQYVLPEVIVQKSGDEYVVTTNDDYIPHLRISNVYKDLMAQGENTAEVKNYIRDKIRAGKFLIKSLHQRQQTILNVAREIVKRQSDFMKKGVAHLKPMTMAQIAEIVGVHETTVSRAVSGKYMQTPQGVFDMKFFFTTGLRTAGGEDVSNTSVKDTIAEIFKHEDTSSPLSDREVVKKIGEKGITIARRTVAKYREELHILPSNLRKVGSSMPRREQAPVVTEPPSIQPPAVIQDNNPAVPQFDTAPSTPPAV
jgi:RNA polymerase sigma-54 factor